MIYLKKIYNENLKENLQIILNKKEENITEDDLSNINSLSFTKMDKKGNQAYLVNELLNFKNLHTLSINNSNISLWDIRILSDLENIDNINFDHCFFKENAQNMFHYIKSLKKLSFRNCYIEDYSKMFDELDLNSLEVIYPYNEETINVNNLSNLINLKFLILEGCNIKNEEMISNLKNLEILSLISTEVKNLKFINEMSKLNKVYLSPKYIKNIDIGNCKAKILTSYIDMVIDDENYSKGLV
ncbi:MAG: hypothetical protein PUD59_04030 [bacterium]|nr:hypothetical protein [bacterium]